MVFHYLSVFISTCAGAFFTGLDPDGVVITDAMIMEIPMMTEPIISPRAIFWSSSISFLIEKGEKSVMSRKSDPHYYEPEKRIHHRIENAVKILSPFH